MLTLTYNWLSNVAIIRLSLTKYFDISNPAVGNKFILNIFQIHLYILYDEMTCATRGSCITFFITLSSFYFSWFKNSYCILILLKMFFYTLAAQPNFERLGFKLNKFEDTNI